MRKFRWEYDYDRWPTRSRAWFLFLEGLGGTVILRSYEQARCYLPDNHPAMPDLRAILSYSTEPVTLLPFAPVAISDETLSELGPRVAERVERKLHEARVYGLAEGRVWHHVPGDSAR